MSLDRPSLLLSLPDPCLLAVLQLCAAAGPRSLFSAACAHSRLHAVAAAALSGVDQYVDQQRTDSLQVYLSRHGQALSRLRLLHLQGPLHCPRDQAPVTLRHLPRCLKLESLALEGFCLQVQPGGGYEGVLCCAGMAPLTRLQLRRCMPLDGGEALAAALTQLSQLEHLSLCLAWRSGQLSWDLRSDVLQHLGRLTHLDLSLVRLRHPDSGAPDSQHLQALTRLQHLSLSGPDTIAANALSSAQSLTHLALCVQFQPAILHGKTQLQHLEMQVSLPAHRAELLDALRHLTQLTRLVAYLPQHQPNQPQPPPAAYAALTASATLQHLELSQCRLPDGAWQHLFPASRQLPHLHTLHITGPWSRAPAQAGAPLDTACLVSCCPGLRQLTFYSWQLTAEQLLPLQGLPGLQYLNADCGRSSSDQLPGVLEALGQLSGLAGLLVTLPGLCTAALLLPLTQLQQLQRLAVNGIPRNSCFQIQASDDAPVCQQLAQYIRCSSELLAEGQPAPAAAEAQ